MHEITLAICTYAVFQMATVAAAFQEEPILFNEPLRVLPGHPSFVTNTDAHMNDDQPAVRGIAFSTDGMALATGGTDRTVHVWDELTEERPSGYNIDDRQIINCLDISDRDGFVVRGGHFSYFEPGISHGSDWTPRKDGCVVIFDRMRDFVTSTLIVSKGVVTSVCLSDDEKQIAVGTDAGIVEIWEDFGERFSDPNELYRRRPLVHSEDEVVVNVAFSRDGQYLATTGPTDVKLWKRNQATPAQKWESIASFRGAFSSCFSPDSRFVAFHTRRGDLDIINLDDLESRQTLSSTIASLPRSLGGGQFVAQGDLLFVSNKYLLQGFDRLVAIWDVERNELLGYLDTQPSNSIFNNRIMLSYSEELGMVATATRGAPEIKLWSLEDLIE